eukprot:CAMPEP_0115551474 /NCGR_PEP_ID=MMETSP0271-20121206/95749_1 /TAXON_ID=71861 /ORGANISM="Scrippsiella trochoidea, Strain CCMP3099" /LENGTH=754 /DNA_ID=CAMNT_0002985075 /DNA_START=102 /DNA_END=2367 /DNA_ORIENTATION=+
MSLRGTPKALILLCAVPIASAVELDESCACVSGRNSEGHGQCVGQRIARRPPFLLQFEKSLERTRRKEVTFDRFCGIAANNEQGNSYSSSDLATAAAVSGMSAQKIWHYNWQMSARNVHIDGVQFVPMIKYPGQGVNYLPLANQDGRGSVVKGWNEPDDVGQAGRDSNLRSNPEAYAQAWTSDMQVAQAKGYTEFVSPAMAHDTCWLDHFLKACEGTAGCRSLVTYLAFHRYRLDCSTYVADPGNIGFRDDLSYVLTYYRLMQKYNARGFSIKGLVWDELGCLTSGYTPAPESDQLRYMREWYQSTLVKVKLGDVETMNKIRGTNWIMPKGPDAHAGQAYTLGACRAQDGGTTAAEDSLKAIQSLVTVAWFSISPGVNHLFQGQGLQGLSQLGQIYFDACKTVQQSNSNGNDNGQDTGDGIGNLGCQDSDSSCQHWASLGYCAAGHTYESHMHQVCKLSCNLCGTAGSGGSDGHEGGDSDGTADSGLSDGSDEDNGQGSGNLGCQDSEMNCAYWAGLGFCEEGNVNEAFMHEACKVSCNLCGTAGSGDSHDHDSGDSNGNGDGNADSGDSTGSEDENGQGSSQGCQDSDASCSHWAGLGYCEEGNTYETYMHGTCRLSCNFCGTDGAGNGDGNGHGDSSGGSGSSGSSGSGPAAVAPATTAAGAAAIATAMLRARMPMRIASIGQALAIVQKGMSMIVHARALQVELRHMWWARQQQWERPRGVRGYRRLLSALGELWILCRGEHLRSIHEGDM